MDESISYRMIAQDKKVSYFDEKNNRLNYIEEKNKEKIELRKKKLLNIIFIKRKESLKSFMKKKMIEINSKRIIDINQINCEEEIKNDLDKFINTKFEINNWTKYLFSSNKNNIQLSLFLIKRYIELQLINKTKRNLSNNNEALIQTLCEFLLNDDVKIIYYACSCLTNLTFFPKNVESLIYTENNLEKISNFFIFLSNNISTLGYECLFLFINISSNINVKKYLIKNVFLTHFYNFINTIINNKKINDKFNTNVIKYCTNILSSLIRVCQTDDNYINYFLPFIFLCKIITSNFTLFDSLNSDENFINDLLIIWKFYSKKRKNNEELIKEILKNNFLKDLISLYNKLDDIEGKKEIMKIFCDFTSLGEEEDKTLIKDGIINFFSDEINEYQNSDIEILNNVIFSCSNLALGNIGQIETLFISGIIYKIIDIAYFCLKDKMDNERIKLIKNSIIFIINIFDGSLIEIKKDILKYKKCIIILIYCNILKLELELFNKDNLFQKIIVNINDINMLSEELDPDIKKEYVLILINNSFEELLIYYSNKKYLKNESSFEIIENIKDFIKKEKNISLFYN